MGKKVDAPVAPECPATLRHVWLWYCELTASRQSNAVGPEPVLWREILAWSQLTGESIRPDEARLLRRLDTEYLAVWYAAHAKKPQDATKNVRPAPKAKK